MSSKQQIDRFTHIYSVRNMLTFEFGPHSAEKKTDRESERREKKHTFQIIQLNYAK